MALIAWIVLAIRDLLGLGDSEELTEEQKNDLEKGGGEWP